MFVGSKYRKVKEGSFIGWEFLEVMERSVSFKTTRNREDSDGRKYSVTSYSYTLHCIARETLDSDGEPVDIPEEELDSDVIRGFYDMMGPKRVSWYRGRIPRMTELSKTEQYADK
tara:strand:+ start:1226 stop:1570 length:345 start_codon:yes stop_codon:yes gene_type:complete